MKFEDITDITKQKKNILQNTNNIILFYADWCGHCIEFKDYYTKVVRASRINKDIKFYKMNCSDMEDKFTSELCKKYDVSGYPTIIKTLGDNTYERFVGKRYENVKNKEGKDVKKISNEFILFVNNN